MKLRLASNRGSRILYFGQSGRNLVENYLAGDDLAQFRSPSEEVVIPAALRMLSRGWPSGERYLQGFLEHTRPTHAVTFEDNFLNFYLIKKFLPSCITVAIQNGRRDQFSHEPNRNFFDELHALANRGGGADYVCTFADTGTALYQNALGQTTKIIPIGSLRNNALPIQSEVVETQSPRMLFVSSLPNETDVDWKDSWKQRTFGYYGQHRLTYEDMYKAEALVSRRCARAARELGIEFIILGKKPRERSMEHDFYAHAIPDNPWRLQSPVLQSSNYRFVNRRDVIITVDSTLGYELLSQGLRVGFVSIRLSLLGLVDRRDCNFGFPSVKESSGPFWTTAPDLDEIDRVIHDTAGIAHHDLSNLIDHYSPIVMNFDNGNTRFVSVLNEIELSNRGPRVWDEFRIPPA